MADFPGSIWMIGCGNMAGAMLARWLATGLDPARVTVIRPSGEAAGEGVRVLPALPEEPPPDLLLLGFKPLMLDAVAADVAARVGPGTTVVSILAGVESATLRARFPAAGTIIRAVPNTPVAIGKGVVALFSADASSGQRASVESLMTPLGLVEWIDDEYRLAACGALAGCGPAFLFRFIDAMAEAGQGLGLPPDIAARLAKSMVEGAAMLAANDSLAPAQLAERVASPGGTTRAGLNVLDADGALVELLRETLAAARRRAAEMAEAARPS